MTLTADQRAAAAELHYLVAALEPPRRLGDYALTGHLARSATASLYTARGPLFGQSTEGVLKLTGTGYAPIVQRELDVLSAAARADVPGVVRPLSTELLWFSASGDRPVAALALPFLSGGDLGALIARAARAGALGRKLALEVARPVAEALRGLRGELDEPLVHGDLRPQHVLLPTPDAPLANLTLIDFDAALSTRDARADAGDVRGFGELLGLVATGDARAVKSSSRAFDALMRSCLGGAYESMADARLWSALGAAEAEATRASAPGRWGRIWRW